MRQLKTGDTIKFNYNPSSHNLRRFNTLAAYNTCNFALSTLLSSTSTGSTVAFPTVGTFRYGCGVGSHCSGSGQKITVVVTA